MELWIKFWENKRQYSAFNVIDFTTVTEHIIFFAMSMKIEASLNFVTLVNKVRNLIFYREYLWMKKTWGRFPISVQVHSAEIASEISWNYSVDIYHRNALDNKVLEEVIAFRTVLTD